MTRRFTPARSCAFEKGLRGGRIASMSVPFSLTSTSSRRSPTAGTEQSNRYLGGLPITLIPRRPGTWKVWVRCHRGDEAGEWTSLGSLSCIPKPSRVPLREEAADISRPPGPSAARPADTRSPTAGVEARPGTTRRYPSCTHFTFLTG